MFIVVLAFFVLLLCSRISPFIVNMLRKSRTAHCPLLHSLREGPPVRVRVAKRPLRSGVSTQI